MPVPDPKGQRGAPAADLAPCVHSPRDQGLRRGQASSSVLTKACPLETEDIGRPREATAPEGEEGRTPGIPACPLPHPPRFWRQVGGHLRVVEANSRGVVWGIGYDHTAWVYTGGYGGGCFQGEGGPRTLAGGTGSLGPAHGLPGPLPPLIPVWLPCPTPELLSQC